MTDSDKRLLVRICGVTGHIIIKARRGARRISENAERRRRAPRLEFRTLTLTAIIQTPERAPAHYSKICFDTPIPVWLVSDFDISTAVWCGPISAC